jgi:hypothetical protein
MKHKILSSLIVLLTPFIVFCQNGTVQNANIPKDAAVNVRLTDFKNNVLNNESVIFKSKLSGREYRD